MQLTLRGPELLYLPRDPISPLEAANKRYVDTVADFKVNLSGGTLTGQLKTSLTPVAADDLSRKGYVDSTLSSHASSTSLHFTIGQKAFIEALTVSAQEVNRLAGLTGTVVSLLDTKLDKAGGTVSGDITMSTDKNIYVSKTPLDDNELVNKAYVDARLRSLEWIDPVTCSNLISENLSSPPGSQVKGDVYIVGPFATGAWTGKEGYATTYLGGQWVFLQTRAVAAGDRFGVKLTSSTVAGGSLLAGVGKIATIVTAIVGGNVWRYQTPTAGSTTLVFDEQAADFGVTYTFNDEGNWVAIGTSITLAAGSGLQFVGNLLNAKLTDGLVIVNDAIGVNLPSVAGLAFTSGKLDLKLKTSDFQITSDGLTLSTTARGLLDNSVAKSGTSEVSGSVVFLTGSTLRVTDAPSTGVDAANKSYVDTKASTLQGSIDTLTGAVSALQADPVTASYVNTELAKKLNKTGGAMTGLLTLSADPTSDFHASTKSYVDTSVSTHASDASLHLTPAQNTLIDALTVTSDEINRLSGVTGNVQSQLNGKLALTGGVLSASLSLNVPPSSALHATNKQYVDASISTLATTVSANAANIVTLQGSVDGLLVDPVTKFYVDVQDNSKVSKAGSAMTGFLSLNADPTSIMHAATKQYVDSVAQGLNVKASIRYATTVNLNATYSNATSGVNATLIGVSNGALSVDGATPQVGDRILVRLQTDLKANGDYTVEQLGNASFPFILKRSVSADQSSEIPGSYFFVYDGATLKATSWVLTVSNPTTFVVGVDNISVTQFSAQGNITGGDGLILSGSTLNVVTASSARITVAADAIDLAMTGVAAGTYSKVTLDAYGRAMAGSNPTTLAGYGITDAQGLNSNLTSLSSIATAGLLVFASDGSIKTRRLAISGVGLSLVNDGSDSAITTLTITSNATSASTASTLVSRDASGNFSANTITANLAGTAASATALANSRNFSITGDLVASSVSFNGTANVVLAGSLSDTGVAPGSYSKVVLDTKGRATAGSNPTTLAGYGITDAVSSNYVDAQIAALNAKIDELYAYIRTRL